jgi:hypothetical protein
LHQLATAPDESATPRLLPEGFDTNGNVTLTSLFVKRSATMLALDFIRIQTIASQA